jgi:hypothetical protein
MPSARMAGMSAELPGPLGVIYVPARGEYVRPAGHRPRLAGRR